MAAGITAVAQGSDGGGSIRIPGSLSGIYGIKATQGRVPRRHVDEHSHSIFNNSSVGPMTWSVRDAALLLNALAGPAEDAEYGTLADEPPDFTAALARGVSGTRIGLDTSGMGGRLLRCRGDGGGGGRRAGLRRARSARRGDRVRPGRAPGDRPHLSRSVLHQGVRDDGAINSTTRRRPRASPTTSPRTWKRGRRSQGTDYLACMNKVGRYRAHAARFFADYDLLLTPATATTAFAIGEYPQTVGGAPVAHRRFGFTPFTYLFNLSGNPAATVPCGFDSAGLPIGLQIAGGMEDEMTVLAASAAFESARPWSAARPALPD